MPPAHTYKFFESHEIPIGVVAGTLVKQYPSSPADVELAIVLAKNEVVEVQLCVVIP